MKERVDHTNYEAWLLDRMEGRLSPGQLRQLEEFLARHPELRPEDGPLPSLSTDDVSGEWEFLKKSIPPVAQVTAQNVEEYLIARLEGDLTAAQQLALEKFLYEHPEHATAAGTYARTRLLPGEATLKDRDMLMRSIPPVGLPTPYNVEDHIIAHFEKDLSDAQEKALEELVRTEPDMAALMALHEKARVRPEEVHYAHMAGLKKGARIIPITFSNAPVRWAAAASIALLFALGTWWLMRVPADENASLAVLKEQTSPEVQGTMPDNKGPAEGGAVEHAQPDEEVIENVQQEAPAVKPVRTTTPERKSTRPSTDVVPVVREEQVPAYADQRPVTMDHVPEPADPLYVHVEEITPEEIQDGIPEALAEQPGATNVAGLVATTFRERVLAQPGSDDRPLDKDDAFAVVDRGLRALSGENAGLDVERTDGRVRRFGLRVGNFAITASTGR